jgi:hypothetical protein
MKVAHLLSGRNGVMSMNAVYDPIESCELGRRRLEEIKRTLRYLSTERSDLERNASWMDAAACQRRKSLLDDLTAWYKAESEEISEALRRLEGSDSN